MSFEKSERRRTATWSRDSGLVYARPGWVETRPYGQSPRKKEGLISVTARSPRKMEKSTHFLIDEILTPETQS
jgi:hypothetical protein